jgi:DNA-binding transcriptional MerR regulator
MDKSPDAFRTIREVAERLDLPQHVLRFWESRFAQIKPLKRGGGRRYYRPDDVELLAAIKHLLYGEGYTIKGVQRLFREQGARGLLAKSQTETLQPEEVDPQLRHAPPENRAPVRLADPGRAAALSSAAVEALRAALGELAEAARILAQGRAG